jgi:uncharacterized protein (UPF0147 family)
MYTLPEAIADKATELFNAIKHAKDDLQIECAEVSLNGDFSRLALLTTKHGNLQELERDIISVLENFENKHKAHLNVKPSQPKYSIDRTRKSGGHIRVTLAGKVIEERFIADTFVEVLKIFGFERVASLNKSVCGIPLFAKTPTTRDRAQQHIGDWHITTHVNKQTAKSILEDISKELNMPIRVEIVER